MKDRSRSPRLAALPFFRLLMAFSIVCVASTAVADIDWSTVPYTAFAEMQAVNGDGSSSWTIPLVGPDDQQAYRVVGVVVNDPATMLDATAGYAPDGPMWNLGGQWQVGIQAVDAAGVPSELLGDHGGALVWMGQNYGNHIWHYPDSSYSYTDAEWLAEMTRLNYPIDAATGEPVTEPLRKGDLIEVRARGGLAYRGKFNINEQHDNDPLFDFDIVVLARDVAVDPVAMSLSDVKDAADVDIFDATGQSGGELYQAGYVRLQDVQISDAAGWGDYGQITVTDGEGRTLPVRLGTGSYWDAVEAPEGTFDLIGLFDQDSGSGRDGYQMWVFGLDGFLLDADIDGNGFVGSDDLDIVRASWEQTGGAGDISGDGLVGSADLDLIRANWGFGTAPASTAVPEPATIWLLIAGILAVASSRLSGRVAK